MEPDGGDLGVEFGAALRAAREARGLSTRAAATACRLSEDQVHGLEKNERGSFYSDTYAARAARSYAAYLGVPWIAAYEQAAALAPPAGPLTVGASLEPVASFPRRRRPGRIAVWLATTGLVSAIALLVITRWEPRRETAPAVLQEKPGVESPTAASAPPEPVTPGPIAASAASHAGEAALSPPAGGRGRDDATASSRFFLQIFRDVGLTAKDSTGRILIHGRLSPLAGRRLVGTPPFRVVATDAEAIAVFYRGQRVRFDRDADGEWRAEFGAPEP